jgi:hypothetical protein
MNKTTEKPVGANPASPTSKAAPAKKPATPPPMGSSQKGPEKHARPGVPGKPGVIPDESE